MADQGFPKQSRLLSAKEYGPVFNQPDFRVSSRFLLVLARSSNQAFARLGIVVARKNIPKAVERNRIKRIIRESFRSRKSDFGRIDMVVLARRGFSELNNCDLHTQLSSLFDELCHAALQK